MVVQGQGFTVYVQICNIDFDHCRMFLPSPGIRINLHGNTGTVRFVGPVDNTTGTWLGIEWDNPHRGKHDGIKDNKRYFTCRYGFVTSSFYVSFYKINFHTPTGFLMQARSSGHRRIFLTVDPSLRLWYQNTQRCLMDLNHKKQFCSDRLRVLQQSKLFDWIKSGPNYPTSSDYARLVWITKMWRNQILQEKYKIVVQVRRGCFFSHLKNITIIVRCAWT